MGRMAMSHWELGRRGRAVCRQIGLVCFDQHNHDTGAHSPLF